VRRRTFAGLTGISAATAFLPPLARPRPHAGIEPLALMLTAQMTGTASEPSQMPPGITVLAVGVSRARKQYQACRYSELISHLPGLLSQLDAACASLDGDDKLRAYALSADAYHFAAGFPLKTGDHGLPGHRSQHDRCAGQPGSPHAGTSARIVTHTLMNTGHLAAAIAAAENRSLRLRRETATHTPESLSVYGSVLLRQVGTDANLHRTAFEFFDEQTIDEQTIDEQTIAEQTGTAVRSQYSKPGAPRSLIPDAILVAPATYNTICKWAQGISDTYALGVLAETTGLGVPTVVLPFVNTALASRIPYRRSVGPLAACAS
jgi:flavoprotein